MGRMTDIGHPTQWKKMKNRPVIGVVFGVGWYIALSLLIPFAIGLWLDKRKFNSFPLLTFIGLGLGTIIMVFGVYRMIQHIISDEKDRNKNNKKANESSTCHSERSEESQK